MSRIAVGIRVSDDSELGGESRRKSHEILGDPSSIIKRASQVMMAQSPEEEFEGRVGTNTNLRIP